VQESDHWVRRSLLDYCLITGAWHLSAGAMYLQMSVTNPTPCLWHACIPHLRLLVEFLEFVPLLLAAVPADGRHIQHPISELDEGAPLDGNIEICHIVQDEVDQLFELVLPKVLFQALNCKHFGALVRNEAILRERVVCL
jgi:hypothetical protein